MKKITLMLTLLTGFTLTAVGCSSHETQTAPETSPLSRTPVPQDQSTAAPAQTDPSVQSADGIYSSPAVEAGTPQATAQ